MSTTATLTEKLYMAEGALALEQPDDATVKNYDDRLTRLERIIAIQSAHITELLGIYQNMSRALQTIARGFSLGAQQSLADEIGRLTQLEEARIRQSMGGDLAELERILGTKKGESWISKIGKLFGGL